MDVLCNLWVATQLSNESNKWVTEYLGCLGVGICQGKGCQIPVVLASLHLEVLANQAIP